MNKHIFSLLMWFGAWTSLFAQDIILKTSGEEIQVKVEEVGTSEVKYKKFSNLSGPVYVMQHTEIFMIKYETGDKDLFEENEETGKIRIRHIENPNPKPLVNPSPVVQKTATKASPAVLPKKPETPPPPTFDARKGTFDIMDLLENGIVEAEPKGDDITTVNLRIRRKVNYPVTVQVPVGTYFVSANPSAQNMVSTAQRKITLSSSTWNSLYVPAACANRPKDIPDSGDRFTIMRSPDREELVQLMPVLNKATVETPVKQAAVWIITDNADYDDLGILVSSPGNGRVIGATETARAMKICSEAGIDISKKNIWKDKENILDKLPAGTLKTWLKTFGVPAEEATPAASNVGTKGKSKPVKIKYMEDIHDGKTILNAVIHLVYYDQEKSKWIDVFANSGSKGIVSFDIPLNKEGASYSFFYAVSPEDKANKMAMAEKEQLRLFRIPADPGIVYLELWVDKNGMLSNKVGSIQIWSKE
jgi:hypothetical protein